MEFKQFAMGVNKKYTKVLMVNVILFILILICAFLTPKFRILSTSSGVKGVKDIAVVLKTKDKQASRKLEPMKITPEKGYIQFSTKHNANQIDHIVINTKEGKSIRKSTPYYTGQNQSFLGIKKVSTVRLASGVRGSYIMYHIDSHTPIFSMLFVIFIALVANLIIYLVDYFRYRRFLKNPDLSIEVSVTNVKDFSELKFTDRKLLSTKKFSKEDMYRGERGNQGIFTVNTKAIPNGNQISWILENSLGEKFYYETELKGEDRELKIRMDSFNSDQTLIREDSEIPLKPTKFKEIKNFKS